MFCLKSSETGEMARKDRGCSIWADSEMVEEDAECQAGKDRGLILEMEEIGLVMSETDVALDLYEAQPLQNMEFLKSGEVMGGGSLKNELLVGAGSSKGAVLEDISGHDKPWGESDKGRTLIK